MPRGSPAEQRLSNLGEFSHNHIGTQANQEPNGIGIEFGIGLRVLLHGYSKKAGQNARSPALQREGKRNAIRRMALLGVGSSDTPYLAFTVQREYTLISL